MNAIFLKLFEQLNGAVFVLILILIIAFWAAFKLGSIVNLFGVFKEKNKELNDNIKSINKNLANVRATTDLLYQTHLATVKSHSPVSLTTKGEDISRDLNISNKVAVHWDEIRSKIEETKPSNPYDIQVIAMDLARNCFDNIFSNEEKDEIKIYAFNKGENLLQIFPVIGVIIRDKYLQEKGISAGEIDAHDPNKK